MPFRRVRPKLGTAIGGLGAYMHVFDEKSRVSLFGVSYQYTTTHSQSFSTFARTSSGADHHRIVVLTVFGHIENNYDDYLGTDQPLRTEDDLKAFAGRYHYRVKGDWFIGGQAAPPITRCWEQPPKMISHWRRWV